MARKSGLGPVALANLANSPVGNIQQGIILPGVQFSNSNAMLVDQSPKFLAIPPVFTSAVGLTPRGTPSFSPVGFSNHLALEGPPFAAELYRADEFYLAFGSTVNTQVGAWIPGGIQKVIPLDPGLIGDTMAFCATVGTSPLRVNFLQ